MQRVKVVDPAMASLRREQCRARAIVERIKSLEILKGHPESSCSWCTSGRQPQKEGKRNGPNTQ